MTETQIYFVTCYVCKHPSSHKCKFFKKETRQCLKKNEGRSLFDSECVPYDCPLLVWSPLSRMFVGELTLKEKNGVEKLTDIKHKPLFFKHGSYRYVLHSIDFDKEKDKHNLLTVKFKMDRALHIKVGSGLEYTDFMIRCAKAAKRVRAMQKPKTAILDDAAGSTPTKAKSKRTDKTKVSLAIYEDFLAPYIEQNIEMVVEGNAVPLKKQDVISYVKTFFKENMEKLKAKGNIPDETRMPSETAITRAIGRCKVWRGYKDAIAAARREKGIGISYISRHKKGEPYKDV